MTKHELKSKHLMFRINMIKYILSTIANKYMITSINLNLLKIYRFQFLVIKI